MPRPAGTPRPRAGAPCRDPARAALRRTPMTYTSAARGVVQLQREERVVADRERRELRRRREMYAAVASSMPNQSGRSRRTSSQSRERSAGRSISTTLIALRETAAATSSTSASVSVRQSRSVRPSRTSAMTGGSPSRSGSASYSSTAHAALGSSASGSAPPPTRATVSSTSPPTSSARRSARARTTSIGSWSMRSTGTSSRVAGSSASASVPSSAASVSLSARSARCSGCRRSRSTRSARPTTMPACGPPSSLSPEKQTRSAPARRLSAGVGSSPIRRERARAEVVDERELVAPRDRGELRELRALREADDAEVRLVDAQENSRLRPDRVLVVGSARAIRRSHLDEPRAGTRKHVGDPEAVSDLDQLAARDDDLACPRRAQRARGGRPRRCC